MKKKKNEGEIASEVDSQKAKDNLILQGISDTLEKNYMPYAMSVIVSRAIPEIDGFKPSHRKLLYTMYKMRLLKGIRTKSANIVGQTMKLNPHGDQAIYATMVRLSEGNESLLHPLVASKGNFGKATSRDMKFAAARYTEAKLSEICEEIFADIDKNTVEFIDNYDGTMKEPKLLPTTFPNILTNPNKGIAVGMASSMPSFNLNEVCDATIAYMKNNKVDVTEYIKSPDFPSGGNLIFNEVELKKVCEIGSGSFKVRSKYEYFKKDNCVEITEIPYTTTVEQIIEKIVECVKLGKIKEISDVRDETGLEGLKITIDLKRGVDHEKLMAKLFKMTSLEDSFSANMNLLIDGEPKVLGVKDIIGCWVDFRKKSIKGSTQFEVDKIEDELHLLKGLAKVLLDIDKAIEIIRNTEENSAVVPNLIDYFDIDEIQANYVADIKLRNINKQYILNKVLEKDELEVRLKELKDIIENPKKIERIIVKDLKRVSKKYGKPRITKIISSDEVIVHDPTVHIEDYKVKIFITNESYLKKVTLVSLRSSGNHKLKEGDAICHEYETNNLDSMIFFSDKYNAYKINVHEIPEHKVSSLGIYVPNLLQLEAEEKIIYSINTSDYKGHMIFAFENGKIAKIPLTSYQTKTNRKKLVKSYSDFSKLVGIHFSAGSKELYGIRVSGSSEYRAILLDTDIIPEKATKSSRGIQVVRMTKNSKMIELVEKNKFENLNEDEFRIKSIPKSGKELDPMTIMTLSKILGK